DNQCSQVYAMTGFRGYSSEGTAMIDETTSAPAKPFDIVSQDHATQSIIRPLLVTAIVIILLIVIVLYFVVGHFVDDLLHIFTNLFQ
ncbi:MAG TPA: hypothetical protein VKB76_12430, partial [Ktedonobacterales bacterium]|nr:hypothetical protein [Ktedonobacterales bacterium]